MRLIGRRVGLLGGSFNPAHDGHRHISLLALKRLRLDEIWWLVSPQNPLKPTAGMERLEDRLIEARRRADHPNIKVTDIERDLGTRYTADTLVALQKRFPAHRFIWLMGADNLLQISRWRAWQQIFNTLPIAVFARPTYSLRAMSGQAAQRFARHRVRERECEKLVDMPPPAWAFLHIPIHHASATRIRARRAALGSDGRSGNTTEGVGHHKT